MKKTIDHKWKHLPMIIALLLITGITSNTALAAACRSNCLSVFSNTLTDNGTYLHGIVKLWDETHAGAAARGSVVHGRWTRPDGSTLDQFANIGTRLRAEFRLYGATQQGTYSLTVVDVTKTGYTFDPEKGKLLISYVTVGGSTNQPPVAVVNADATSGSVPLTVNFNSDSSQDPDGTLVDYSWSFGDGYTAIDANPSHTYISVGVFNATLTVTDDMGATAAGAMAITVVEGELGCQVNCMAVDRISMRYKPSGNRIKGLVWLVDENDARVQQAVVHGIWTHPDGTTIDRYVNVGTRGRATFDLTATDSGIYRLAVTEITKAGHTFDPDNSNLLTGLIEVAP